MRKCSEHSRSAVADIFILKLSVLRLLSSHFRKEKEDEKKQSFVPLYVHSYCCSCCYNTLLCCCGLQMKMILIIIFSSLWKYMCTCSSSQSHRICFAFITSFVFWKIFNYSNNNNIININVLLLRLEWRKYFIFLWIILVSLIISKIFQFDPITFVDFIRKISLLYSQLNRQFKLCVLTNEWTYVVRTVFKKFYSNFF